MHWSLCSRRRCLLVAVARGWQDNDWSFRKPRTFPGGWRSSCAECTRGCARPRRASWGGQEILGAPVDGNRDGKLLAPYRAVRGHRANAWRLRAQVLGPQGLLLSKQVPHLMDEAPRRRKPRGRGVIVAPILTPVCRAIVLAKHGVNRVSSDTLAVTCCCFAQDEERQ